MCWDSLVTFLNASGVGGVDVLNAVRPCLRLEGLIVYSPLMKSI